MTRVQRRFEVSQRRACRLTGQPRSTQRYVSKIKDDEATLVKQMHEIVRRHPRYGYRRVWALLRADGDTDLARVLREFGVSARRGSAAVIITPAVETDWLPQLAQLARQGVECQVILLDRASFGGEGNSETLRQTINLLGVRCATLRQGDLGRPIVEEEHQGFWEFKITGTGKAVAVRRPPGAR